MPELYYTPPADELFEDLKQAALQIWNGYPNPLYRDSKINAIKDIKNVQDNFMYMVAMFDENNQKKLGSLIQPETSAAVRERLIAGGAPEYLISF